MNSDTVNTYGFHSNEVIECEYEIATIFGKTDRIILRYINYLKNKVKYDDQSRIKRSQEDDEAFVAINAKKLGFSWHKQNMNKRKGFPMRKNFIQNENLNSCPSNDHHIITPRIPITSLQLTLDIQCFNSYLEICPVIYKSFTNLMINTTFHDYNESSKSSNITTFAEKTKSSVNGYDRSKLLRAKSRNVCLHQNLHTRSYNSILYCAWVLTARPYFQQQNYKIIQMLIIILLTLTQYSGLTYGLLVSKVPSIGLNITQISFENSSDLLQFNNTLTKSSINHNNSLTETSFNLEHGGESDRYLSASKNLVITSSTEGGSAGVAYLEKLANLERSLAAVLLKVAYGTTSTTKRSIPENNFVPRLTTIATPLLTTLRFQDKAYQTQTNVHHRNYELDLERDHALPTSAPNADILKSNSNPTYPNPNRNHNHERDRNRHLINSTPQPSLPNILKKSNVQLPTIPMFPGGDIPSYSPPARSFFTPPLPPEYQHPFADKPTLRGTNNDGGVVQNTGSYINRRPIPPPSLMPGQERIPFRPPDLVGTTLNNVASAGISSVFIPSVSGITTSPLYLLTTTSVHWDINPKKTSTTPSKTMFTDVGYETVLHTNRSINASSSGGTFMNGNNPLNYSNPEVRKKVLPSIRRILSGSNGRKGDIPEVLLKQVTTRPNNYHHPPSSPVVLIDSSLTPQNEGSVDSVDSKQNINKIKNMRELENNYDENTKITATPFTESHFSTYDITSTPSAAAATGSEKTNAIYAPVATPTTVSSSTFDFSLSDNKNDGGASSSSTSSVSSSTSSSTLASGSTFATWSLAWNIHVYLSVVFFTILAVYSFYKIITYNKLTYLFSQSYFLCIHLILIIICVSRTFYLCYDAYNIHSSFHIFISEILLNLPATFLTITFAVLILFLSLKSLNHKHNRYSALIRPLTVVVACGVHVVLCITLHYVEYYTLQNHNQHLYYQQQQQLLTKRKQLQQQHLHYNFLQNQNSYAAVTVMGLENIAFSSSLPSGHAANFHPQIFATSIASIPPSPPRVLSLICQIIYIFVCFSLGLLYLYLYRILKRILRSKSQNYIHGYQNLSYAIHITIATALLFLLLAALQIFGAISISSTIPLFTQKTAEIDWLQWGYQFSLRLLEIAIITLISWVAGLKTSNCRNSVNINLSNNEVRVPGQINSTNLMFNTNLSLNSVREKHNVQNNQHSHPNMTNFFIPCTSSSSQEQFDTDYPAVCNANTNLHTYTMRTGKLIYDDSFALNSLNVNKAVGPHSNDFQHSNQPQYHKQQQHLTTYQHPYDSQSLNSSAHHNVSEYGSRMDYQPENHLRYNDSTTDHYENPNFDLRGSGSATSGSALVVNSNLSSGANMQQFTKTSISNSTTASSSNNSNMESNSSSGSSATSQQQMLLLQGGGETCYSEPIHESYDFNNFEKPKFRPQFSHENWPDASIHTLPSKHDEKKSLTTLERCGYDKPERRSSNSTHSYNSNTNANNGGGVGSGSRYASFNTFERAPFKNVRKSDTLNNITSNGQHIMYGRNNLAASAGPRNTHLDVQTSTTTENHHSIPTRNFRPSDSSKDIPNPTGLDMFPRSTIERSSINQKQSSQTVQRLHQPHVHHQYSDDDEDDRDDDIMLTVSSHQV